MISSTVAGIDLMELAGVCEKASGPERLLDLAVAMLVFGLKPHGDYDEWQSVQRMSTREGRVIEFSSTPVGPHGGRQAGDMIAMSGWTVFDVPGFTASIDAAASIVPDDLTWCMPYSGPDRWDCRLFHRVARLVALPMSQPCATPALAICAAALRARASLIEEERS